MPEDNESKLEQILSELPRVKRQILEEHLNTLSGEDRDKFVKEVINEYEALKSKVGEKDLTEAFSKMENPDTEGSSKDVEPEDKDTEELSPSEPEDLENNIIEALKSQQTEEKAAKPSLPASTDDKKDSPSQEFTKDPIHTKRRRKSRAPAVIILSLLALIVAGALSYIFVLSKNPAFAAFTSQLGIPVPAQSAAVTTDETEATTESTAEPTATPTPTPSPVPTEATEETTTEAPAPTEIPTPTPIELKSNAPNLKGIKVVIDPGHQMTTDYKKEPYKKGATTGKFKATSGATGVVTGQKEYELTLETALMLKEYLEKCGATVILTRTENDVNISNKQRATIAVKNKPTLFIRLHADHLSNKSVKGVRVYIPKSGKLNKTANGNKLGKLVAKAAGTTFRGTKATNQYTGLNYATSIRSFQIVLGYLSNEEDDKRLADPNNRYEMCAAIATFCSTFKKK